jgi:hypothetical protein
MCGEVRRTGEKVVMAYFKIKHWHEARGTKKSYENPQPG